MSDVKAAAERLRRVQANRAAEDVCWLSRVYDPLWNKGHSNGSWQQDQDLIVTAYLAEHPADEDEPITEEWLRGVGFSICAHWGAMAIGDSDQIALEWDYGKWLIRWRRPSDRLTTDIPIPAPKTRSDLRLLCRALGITLEESS